MKGYQNPVTSSRHAKTIYYNGTYRIGTNPEMPETHNATIPRYQGAVVRRGDMERCGPFSRSWPSLYRWAFRCPSG